MDITPVKTKKKVGIMKNKSKTENTRLKKKKWETEITESLRKEEIKVHI